MAKAFALAYCNTSLALAIIFFISHSKLFQDHMELSVSFFGFPHTYIYYFHDSLLFFKPVSQSRMEIQIS